MAPIVAVPLFVASLAVTLLAARFFAQRLDLIGTRFGLPEAMIGLLTAVAADGPEISSAMIALIKGAHATSVGVLVGSNAFNLAAMIGVGAAADGLRGGGTTGSRARGGAVRRDHRDRRNRAASLAVAGDRRGAGAGGGRALRAVAA